MLFASRGNELNVLCHPGWDAYVAQIMDESFVRDVVECTGYVQAE